MTDTGITVSPVQVDPELDGDHERMSHIVLEGFKPEKGDFISAGPSVVEGMVNGTAVKALCGKIWVPVATRSAIRSVRPARRSPSPGDGRSPPAEVRVLGGACPGWSLARGEWGSEVGGAPER